jgi:hypothetical protein
MRESLSKDEKDEDPWRALETSDNLIGTRQQSKQFICSWNRVDGRLTSRGNEASRDLVQTSLRSEKNAKEFWPSCFQVREKLTMY